MNSEQDTEQELTRQLDLNEKTVNEALNMMDKMARLRGRVHLREGAGQRYLQKLKPEQGLLKQAEQEILSQYIGATGGSAPDKKSKLVRNMAKRNMI